MLAHRARIPVSIGVCGLAIGAAVLAVVTRVVADDFFATSWVALTGMFVTAALLIFVYLTLEVGWIRWRRTVLALAVIVIAYQACWAIAALTTSQPVARAAGLGHIPQITALAAMPLLAVRYIGRGSTSRLVATVTSVAIVNAVGLALFRGGWSLTDGDPLIGWGPGAVIAQAVNTVFLVTTLAGPVVAVRAARRSEGEARRRLVLVAIAALAGPTLVLLCGVLNFVMVDDRVSRTGEIGLYLGLDLALVVVVLGSSRALRAPLALSDSTLTIFCALWLAAASALLALTVAMFIPGSGPFGGLAAAAAAVTVMAAARPAESRVRRMILSPMSEGAADHEQMIEVGPRTPPAADHRLTPREWEVLGLVAEGLSNAGVAARLVLSEKTIEAHLRTIFTKLDLPGSRSDNRRVHAVLAWNQAHARPLRDAERAS